MALVNLDLFGEGAKFDHIGMVVRSIHAIFPDQTCIEDPLQKVLILFTDMNGVKVELLEPTGKNSPVADGLKRGMKLLHMCYSVPHIDAALELCKSNGFHILATPVPAVAFKMRKIAWVFHRQFGLFELVEKQGGYM